MSSTEPQCTSSGLSEGNTNGLDSLADVIAILRYKDLQHLSVLLADAYVDFELLDVGFLNNSDAVTAIVNGAMYAPISACMVLRDLSQEDQDAILEALREVWPLTEASGMYLSKVSYNISRDSLRDELTHLFTSPTGWQRVDRTMNRIRELLTIASTEEHFQEVGVLCREGLISVAQAVFDPTQHPPVPNDSTDVSDTDVKRMLARYVAVEYLGASGQEFRKCVNSTLDLANKVTHRRTSDYRGAALCAQATFNVVGLISLIAGKRDRDNPSLT